MHGRPSGERGEQEDLVRSRRFGGGSRLRLLRGRREGRRLRPGDRRGHDAGEAREGPRHRRGLGPTHRPLERRVRSRRDRASAGGRCERRRGDLQLRPEPLAPQASGVAGDRPGAEARRSGRGLGPRSPAGVAERGARGSRGARRLHRRGGARRGDPSRCRGVRSPPSRQARVLAGRRSRSRRPRRHRETKPTASSTSPGAAKIANHGPLGGRSAPNA